jgi:hypothetical protein
MALKFLADVTLPPLSGFSQGLYKTDANPANRLEVVISNVVGVLTIFGGLAFLFWFLAGALTWASSGGNPEQTNKAKAQMGTAVVGMFVLIIGTAVTWIIGKMTGLDIINLERLINLVRP